MLTNEGLNKGKNKGDVQPHQAAAYMLRHRNCYRIADIFSYKESARYKRIGNAYDYRNASLFSACIV